MTQLDVPQTVQTEESVLENPRIAALVEETKKKGVLAEILGEQHTTQGFGSAEDLAAAFQGELTELPPEQVEMLVQAAKRQYTKEIEEAGITDADLIRIFQKVWIYSRLTNPTNELLEEVISLIEGYEKSATFASGLAAINAITDQFTASACQGESGEYIEGGTIVVIGSIYGGTYAQMEHRAKKMGKKVVYMSITEFLEKGLPEETKLVFFESCNNPTLKVMPINEIVKEAKRVGALTIGDNTFSPLSVCLEKLGVDISVVSMTKYFNGKSEDLGGSVSGKAELIDPLLNLHEGNRMLEGGNMAPRVAREFIKNLADLPQRLYRATQNARGLMQLAQEFGIKVRSMETDSTFQNIRNKDIPSDITNGMVAMYFDSQEDARFFVNSMISAGIGKGAVSLGCQTTYYSIPAETTHSEMPEDEKKKVGITPGLVRVSCGTEPDLVEKMREVLEQIRAKKESLV